MNLTSEQSEQIGKILATTVILHRGASRRYVENSLAAIKEAANIALDNLRGNYFIEADFRTSRDGVLVAMHDQDVHRTTHGLAGHGLARDSRKKLHEFDAAELCSMRLKTLEEIGLREKKIDRDRVKNPWFVITDEDMRVPTIDEVYQLLQETNYQRISRGASPVGFSIDVKDQPRFAGISGTYNAILVGAVYNFIERYGTKSQKAWVDRHPASEAIVPLVQFLNQIGDKMRAEEPFFTPHLTPITIMGTDKPGRKDLRLLWSKLSPENREHFEQGGMVSLQALTTLFPPSVSQMLEDLGEAARGLRIIAHTISWKKANKDTLTGRIFGPIFSWLSPFDPQASIKVQEAGLLANVWTANKPKIEIDKELGAYDEPSQPVDFITTDEGLRADERKKRLADKIRGKQMKAKKEEYPVQLSGVAEVVEHYHPEAVFLDLWGVIHDGEALFPDALKTLEWLKAENIPVVFVSNTPQRAKDAALKLRALGIEDNYYKGIVTAGEAAYEHLSTAGGEQQRYYYIGSERNNILKDLPHFTQVSTPDQAELVIASSFAEEKPTLAHLEAELRWCAELGLPMLCLNPDEITRRRTGEIVSQGGKIGLAYQEMEGAGEVSFFGKPYPEIYTMAERFVSADKSRIVIIGDSPSHDIVGGNANGYTTVLVCNTGILGAELGHFPKQGDVIAACKAHSLCNDQALLDSIPEISKNYNPIPHVTIPAFAIKIRRKAIMQEQGQEGERVGR